MLTSKPDDVSLSCASHHTSIYPIHSIPFPFPFFPFSPLSGSLRAGSSQGVCIVRGRIKRAYLPLLLVVETSQRPLDLAELLLGLRNDGSERLEALLGVGLIASASLVLVRAVVLDLLAAVLDFRQAECCAAAFEEVAEGGELG